MIFYINFLLYAAVLVTFVHAVGFFLFTWMWLNHLSPEYQRLDGAKEIGWFFIHLRFWSLSLQVIQSFFALAYDIMKRDDLGTFADFFSCVSFTTGTI